MHCGRRITPPEGVEVKVGDIVTYEVIYDDGRVGTISTKITDFDLTCYGKVEFGSGREVLRL